MPLQLLKPSPNGPSALSVRAKGSSMMDGALTVSQVVYAHVQHVATVFSNSGNGSSAGRLVLTHVQQCRRTTTITTVTEYCCYMLHVRTDGFAGGVYPLTTRSNSIQRQS